MSTQSIHFINKFDGFLQKTTFSNQRMPNYKYFYVSLQLKYGVLQLFMKQKFSKI